MANETGDTGFRNLLFGSLSAVVITAVLWVLNVAFPEALSTVEITRNASEQVITTRTTKISFLVSMIGLAGVIGAIFAAKFYRDQAEAQTKQAAGIISQAEATRVQTRKIQEQNNQQNFTNYIQFMQPSRTKTDWYIGLLFLNKLAKSFPEAYGELAINSLSRIGERFSDPEQTIDQMIFVKDILRSIGEINLSIRMDPNITKRNILEISRFRIVDSFNIITPIPYFDFTDIFFRQCIFSGIKFYGCNMRYAAFSYCTHVKLEGCLLSVGNVMNKETDFADRNQFSTIEKSERNYIFQRDLSSWAREPEKISHVFFTPADTNSFTLFNALSPDIQLSYIITHMTSP